ncbi:hypothetical protein S83_052164, partial [Arachis hypogaea]
TCRDYLRRRTNGNPPPALRINGDGRRGLSLSLLNSPASLPCSHVFCNFCIVNSMKSSSDCPVCKIPFFPREVRLSPRLLNLVNIYKRMERSSGMNLFLTQNLHYYKFS